MVFDFFDDWGFVEFDDFIYEELPSAISDDTKYISEPVEIPAYLGHMSVDNAPARDFSMESNEELFVNNEYNNEAYSEYMHYIYDINNMSEGSLNNEYINSREDFSANNKHLYNISPYMSNKEGDINAIFDGLVADDFSGNKENPLNFSESIMEAFTSDSEVSFMESNNNILEKINNEEKELIRETEKSLQEISTVNEKVGQSTSVNPTFNITFGDVRETADVNAICSQIRDVIVGELLASCEGVY